MPRCESSSLPETLPPGMSCRQAADGVQGRGAGDCPLLWVLVAASMGIVLDRWLCVSLARWCLLCICLLLAACYYQRRRHLCIAALLVLASVMTLGGIWHHDCWRIFASNEVSRWASDTPAPVVMRVIVRDAPRLSGTTADESINGFGQDEVARLQVQATALRRAQRWESASGQLTLIVNGQWESAYPLRGDLLEVAAVLAAVPPPLNPGEPDFASICRGRRQLAMLLCEHPECVKYVRHGWSCAPLRMLGKWRLWAESALVRHVGAAQAPLAAALLLGSRERLDRDSQHAFFLSGTLHLLAISGLHVSILASMFWWSIRMDVSRRTRFLYCICLMLITYALVTGSRPPVIRATVLVVIYCLALGLGRVAQSWNSLAAAGLVTLGLQPTGLFHTGTQLSYLAVATLIAVWSRMQSRQRTRALDKVIDQSRSVWRRGLLAAFNWINTALIVSGAVTLVSLPLVAFRFHLFTPLGIALNVLLWLPMAVALVSALLTTLLAPLPLAPDLCGSCCASSLALIEALTTWTATLRSGHQWVAGPCWWWVTVFYSGLFVRQFVPFAIPRRWWWALVMTWLALGVWGGSSATRLLRMRDDPLLRVSFVAVGHGLSVLAEFPDGRTLLYDAGRMGSARAAALPISSVLWSRRIRHLDAIVLSHADADHFNAVAELLDRFSVGVIYVPRSLTLQTTHALATLRSAIDAAGVPLGYLHEGMCFDAGASVRVEVLHPPADPTGTFHAGGDNPASTVLLVSCAEHRLLLTGDLEGWGLQELIAERPLTCDVLLAPHHGSHQSNPSELLGWAKPKCVVISAGVSLLDEQLAAYAASGAEVLWTRRDGMIEVISDGRHLSVSSWR